MLRKNRIFTPGPTPLLPAAQFAEASFTAHHRTADFRNLFTRVLADMKELKKPAGVLGIKEPSKPELPAPPKEIKEEQQRKK